FGPMIACVSLSSWWISVTRNAGCACRCPHRRGACGCSGVRRAPNGVTQSLAADRPNRRRAPSARPAHLDHISNGEALALPTAAGFLPFAVFLHYGARSDFLRTFAVTTG